jgi:uncharacterized membrane protein (DUF4010 family)
VLFFTGLSFIGYMARRLAGPDHGYLVTGLLGGLISSTNVTFTFARASRSSPTTDRALAYGAVAANAMLYPRVLIATAILNPLVLPLLASYLAAPGMIAAIATTVGARRSPPNGSTEVPLQNPLQLTAALQMAVLFQVVLMAVSVARAWWGESGVISSATVLGLTDVDALTVAMSASVGDGAPAAVAARALGMGALVNTLVKLGLATGIGRGRFRRQAGISLALLATVSALALVLR